MPDTTLEDAINSAAAELEELAAKESGKPATKVETPEPEEEAEPEESESDEEPPQENPAGDDEERMNKEARILYNALADPKQRGAVIAALAHEAGLLTRQPETKKEEKAQVQSIKDLVKETLGPEYNFLAPKLGEVFEKIVETQRQEQEEKDAVAEQARVVNEVQRATTKLSKETNGHSDKIQDRMNELADQILPGPNMSVDQYLRHLYTLATAGSRSPQKANVEDRQRRNANDSASRLSVKGKSSASGDEVDLNKKRSLNDSIKLAVEEMERKGMKIK
jgi:hypothetical protein